MIVRCATCHAEVDVDDPGVGAGSEAVRCAACEQRGAQAEPAWQIHTLDDLLYSAPDVPTLRAWILEGRLHPDDRASHQGGQFVRLGQIPEFAPLFASEVPGVESDPGPENSATELLGPPPEFVADATHHEAAAELRGVPESNPDVPSEAIPTAGAPRAVAVLPSLPAALPVLTPPAGNLAVSEALSGAHAQAVAEAPRLPPVRPPAPRGSSVVALSSRASASSTRAPVAANRGGVGDAAVDPSASDESGVPPTGESSAVLSSASLRARRPSSGAWRLWAGLGVLAGVAVMLGVPQVRSMLFGGSAEPEPEVRQVDSDTALRQGAAALAQAEPQALGRAEANLALLKEQQGGPDAPKWTLLQAEILATRALVYELWAAVDEVMGNDLRYWAQEDAGRAAALVTGLNPAEVEPLAWARVKALVSLAQGRTDGTGPTVARDPELMALTAAVPMFRNDQARLDPEAIDRLASVPAPTVLTKLLTGLGLHRAGDLEGAQAQAQEVLAEVPAHPAARALAQRVEADRASPVVDGKVASMAKDDLKGEVAGPAAAQRSVPAGAGPSATRDDTPEVATAAAARPPRPPGSTEVATAAAPRPAKALDSSQPAKGGAPKPAETQGVVAVPESTDRLIEKGCTRAEKGDGTGALPLLRRALEQRPRDLDALVCMALAHSKMGAHQAALEHYERALERSPDMLPALVGAAKMAAKLGRQDQAIALYRRVLARHPGHAQAQAYLADHGAGPD